MRRRALTTFLLSAAVVASTVGFTPADAATIPTPPAVCNPAPPTPGNPMLTSFGISHSVDVTNEGKNIRATVTATDATKNITAISLVLVSPKVGLVERSAQINLNYVAGSGSHKDGTWTGTTTIPRWTIGGTWQVVQVGMLDAGGGSAFYFPTSSGSTYPWNVAWPDTVTVTSTRDITPPTVTGLKLSRTIVDTTSATARVYVSVKVNDSRSGVLSVGVAPYRVVGMHLYSSTSTLFKRTSGTAKSGTWTGSFVVPRWVGSGTHFWNVGVGALDAATNEANVLSQDLKSEGLVSRIRVRSTTDSSKPVLRGLTFSPASVDARNGNKTVKAIVTASDTNSGVQSASVTLTSPSGAESQSSAGSTSDKSGVASFTISLPIGRCTEPGVWTASVDLYDNADNTTHYTTAQVVAKHLSGTVNVKALDTQWPAAVVPATIKPTATLPVTFTEPTLWKDATTQTALTVIDTSTAMAVAGTWACTNAASASVTCDANGADVTRATFTPMTPFAAEHSYEVKSTSGDIFDTSGNPLVALDAYVATT